MFFLKKKLLLFQILRQKRSEKGKFFRLCSLNCIIPDRKNGLRKFFLRFEDLFCHFWIFIKNKSERFSKLLSMSLEDRFGKKSFFSKFVVFSYAFRNLVEHFLDFWQNKILVWSPHFRWMNPEEHFEENNVFKEINSFVFILWAKNVQKIAKLFNCVSYTAYYVTRGIFRKIFLRFE